jgi:glycosyltransferase involved in cell wall biosynthesis
VKPGLVSVVVPVFNRSRALREAAESVFSQTYPEWELFVVDDGSTDDTPQVARELADRHPGKVRVLTQSNLGPGAAREAGRLQARGEFVQFLDSDDLLLPQKFELQVAGLRSAPACVASYGGVRWRKPDGTTEGRAIRRTGEEVSSLFPSFLVERWWPTLAPLHRSGVLDRIGPWLPLRLHEDWEYDCRLAAVGGTLHFVPEIIAEIRDLGGDRLSRGRRFDAARLHDRALALAGIFQSARRAAIPDSSREMQHLARHLFLLSRDCAVVGLPGDAETLARLSGEISPRMVLRTFRRLAGILGWKTAGKLALALEGLRKKESQS